MLVVFQICHVYKLRMDCFGPGMTAFITLMVIRYKKYLIKIILDINPFYLTNLSKTEFMESLMKKNDESIGRFKLILATWITMLLLFWICVGGFHLSPLLLPG